jgi:hypothetical protein
MKQIYKTVKHDDIMRAIVKKPSVLRDAKVYRYDTPIQFSGYTTKEIIKYPTKDKAGKDVMVIYIVQ